MSTDGDNRGCVIRVDNQSSAKTEIMNKEATVAVNTYWSGPRRRYVFKSPEIFAFTAWSIASPLHKGVVGPVPMIMSNGLSLVPWSLPANLSEPPQKSINTSSTDWIVEWRRQTGNECPGVKNSQAGNSGLETIVAMPSAPTPTGWVDLWPLSRAFRPNKSLNFVFFNEIFVASKHFAGGRGYECEMVYLVNE